MTSQQECDQILSQLLDFSKPFDIALFDKVVDGFYMKGDMNLQSVVIKFTEHEMAWTRVDFILDQSSSVNSRIVALTVLESVVKSRWHTLPPEQRDGIKNFIVGFIIKISGDETLQRQQAAFLNKLNVVLIQIVKNEWPQNWPTFITDLVESSKTSQSICSNNMQLLLLLSEEVFDFSRDQMTSEKVLTLKTSLNKDFAQIFELCEFILGNSENPVLLTSTLKTLLRFLKWIPVEYIFETSLVETLAMKFFPVKYFQNLALQCLCEISYLKFTDKPQYDNYFVSLFISVMSYVHQNYPPDHDLARIYIEGDEKTQNFLRHLSLFICDFLRSHLMLVENSSEESRKALLSSLAVLLRLSLIDDQESDVVVFNICLEYWNEFLGNLYSEEKASRGPLILTSGQSHRLRFYEETLVNLRHVIISRMAKPEEVLVVTDENGNVVRERLKNSDSIATYMIMREALIYLTHLDAEKTMHIMCTQLNHLTLSKEWNPELLNRLCWATGSISKALNESQEKSFLARVIKDLLNLVDAKNSKDHKAIIAANIMYVVGQYPRFLKTHWSFLTTVIGKLFEFMHEKHPGVQDMACDTFLKIAMKCKSVIATTPTDKPFIQDIITTLPEAIKDLEPSQVLVFYEAVARIVAVDNVTREQLVFKLMEIPNRMWSQAIQHAKQNMNELWNPAVMESIDLVLKTNNHVAVALKNYYMPQLSRIYLEMLNVYTVYSSFVSKKIQEDGEICTRTVVVRKMRSIKKEVLRILTTFVNSCRGDKVVIEKFLPELLQPVLVDYQNVIPAARDHEVLLVYIAFIDQFKGQMKPHINTIFTHIFPSTLSMINSNFEDFPEHRTAFFQLIKSVNEYCFDAILALSTSELKLVMDSVFWSIKHLDRNIQETGLVTLQAILTNFQRSAYASDFYRLYLVQVINELLEVLTDTFHRSAFNTHTTLLAYILGIVQTNGVQVPLYEGNAFPNNSVFIRHHIGTLIVDSFNNLQHQQVVEFIDALFLHHADSKKFKEIVKDFLIQLKEFSPLQEEFNREESERKVREAREAHYQAVPGLHYDRSNQDDQE